MPGHAIRPWAVRHRAFLCAVAAVCAAWLALRVWLIAPDLPEQDALSRARRYHAVFNWCECGIWAAAGIVLLVRGVRAGKGMRGPYVTGGFAALLFGGSDAVEVYTGAWFDPPWLAAWNAVCLLVLGGCLLWHRATVRGTGAR